jgi:EF hand
MTMTTGACFASSLRSSAPPKERRPRGRWETSADRRPVSARSPSRPFTSPSRDAGWAKRCCCRLNGAFRRNTYYRSTDAFCLIGILPPLSPLARKTNPRPRLSHPGAFCDRLYAAIILGLSAIDYGTVSLQEFQAAHERIFKAMDTDKDGTLTLEEIQHFMHGGHKAAPQR